MIAEPGVYEDVTPARYQRDPVEGGSLSSTGARMLTPPNPPALFAWNREHPRPDTDAFDLGRAAHAELLGVGDPIAEIAAKDWRTNAAKEAAAEARAVGATPLLTKDAMRVRDMVAAARRHPVAGPLFARPGRSELVLVYRDPETGVMCRVMADRIPDVDEGERPIVVDYKTTDDAEPGAFARSMARYGYHQQAPWYCDAWPALGLNGGLEPIFVLIAQEKVAPYLVSVTYPDPEAMAYGRELNRQAREIYRDCTEANHWPGYSPDAPQPLALPGYLTHKYDDLIGSAQ
ncbi:PD-(D/E)XK nuclease-like domain-containing protein [Pseudonocardia pini]|uniref:PD-(D/E)XK nuclease-like domain-containing protein n=1 Tax=Pseudonocardia pini TaxID=2758030 RepID=UPI0015F04733|nr:PD-(D/E)XK nuclease-like domain-containing protein [Pseudonocardia pini]